MVLSWILNSIYEGIYLGQIFSKSARVVWDELKQTYDQVYGSLTFNLYQKNNNYLTQNGSSVAYYHRKLNSYWKRFHALTQLPFVLVKLQRVFKNITI